MLKNIVGSKENQAIIDNIKISSNLVSDDINTVFKTLPTTDSKHSLVTSDSELLGDETSLSLSNNNLSLVEQSTFKDINQFSTADKITLPIRRDEFFYDPKLIYYSRFYFNYINNLIVKIYDFCIARNIVNDPFVLKAFENFYRALRLFENPENQNFFITKGVQEISKNFPDYCPNNRSKIDFAINHEIINLKFQLEATWSYLEKISIYDYKWFFNNTSACFYLAVSIIDEQKFLREFFYLYSNNISQQINEAIVRSQIETINNDLYLKWEDLKNQIENVFQGDIKMNEKYHNIKLFEQLFFNYIIDTDERDVFRLYYSLQERILALYSRYKLKINIAFFCNDLESLKKNITSLRALENKIICKMNFFEFYNLVQNNDNF